MYNHKHIQTHARSEREGEEEREKEGGIILSDTISISLFFFLQTPKAQGVEASEKAAAGVARGATGSAHQDAKRKLKKGEKGNNTS